MISETNPSELERLRIRRIVRRVVLGVIGLFGLIILLSSIGKVDVGNVGIKTRVGRVLGTVQPGLYFKAPFTDEVHEMNVQVQKEQADAGAASSDLQTVTAQIAVNYNVDPSAVIDIYSKVGTEYKTKVIDPAIQEATKAATAKYTAEELITKREEVRGNILALLKDRLAENHIIVDQVSIVHFDFSPSFNAAIEAKVTAEQNALAAKNKLEQVKYEAEQRVAAANAEAEAIRVQSNAANNEKYVALKALEVQAKAIEKWNGKLPDQMIPGSAVPFINLK